MTDQTESKDKAEVRDRNGLTEAEAIAAYKRKNYPKPALTADIVILSGKCGGADGAGGPDRNEKPRVLLIKRGGHPFIGRWALPGGFAEEGETIEQTAARELEEETGVTGLQLQLTGIYSRPGRDPRGWTVSAAYSVYLPDGAVDAEAGDDAAEAGWFEVELTGGTVDVKLPDGGGLAFDHQEIIGDAVRVLLKEGLWEK